MKFKVSFTSPILSSVKSHNCEKHFRKLYNLDNINKCFQTLQISRNGQDSIKIPQFLKVL